MSLPLALAQGTIIGGHYIVGSLINSGGFGAVYRGVDTSEGNRPCAIKETYDVTPAARRQALMEASVLFTVRSKHLPEIYDAFEANGRFYLVMQLIEGQNLLQLLRSRIGSAVVGEQEPHLQSHGPCSEQEVFGWLLPVMEVLQELHNRHPAVIHRDIKPGNIILTPDQTAVLVDFGLTKLYDPNTNTQTMVKAVSEGFSPLEQYLGRTSPQSDIYSMAATMYLLLTNRLPPPAMRRSVHDGLIAPRLLNPSLSPKTERVLLKALSVQADQRYQTMAEFIQALQAPSFTAYSDPTIAAAPIQNHANAAPTIKQAPSSPSPSTSHAPAAPVHKQAPPPRSYGGVGRQQQKHGGGAAVNAPAYPHIPATPPGYVMAPQATWAPVRSLPSSFGQGCLWGLLQGVAAALLVLLLKKDAYFFLAILMGFVFYVLAGFTTTVRGGPSLRGAWAGLWAGINSTIMFWVVLGVGLLFLFAQRLQAETALAQNRGFRLARDAPARAWRAVLPEFLTHQTPPGQQPTTNLLILLAASLLIAFSLGWVGGILGRSWFKSTLAGRKQP